MKILVNDKKYLSDFIFLNEEWISKYFQLEDIDRELARKPDKIIHDGGYIFSILKNTTVVGVCALFNLISAKPQLGASMSLFFLELP